MKAIGFIAFSRGPLVLGVWFAGLIPPAASAQSFTIAATNVVMPLSGMGSSQFTLTSINGYTGTIVLNCQPTNPSAGAKLPICSGYTAPAYQLEANATLQGSIEFFPYGVPIPVSLPRHRGGPLSHAPAVGLVLAGALKFGLRARRRAWCSLALVLLGLAGLAGISACGGASSSVMTPGSYPYTVTAMEYNGTTFGTSVSTSILVTVP